MAHRDKKSGFKIICQAGSNVDFILRGTIITNLADYNLKMG